MTDHTSIPEPWEITVSIATITIPQSHISNFLEHLKKEPGRGWWFLFEDPPHSLKSGDPIIFLMPSQSVPDLREYYGVVEWAGRVSTPGQITALLGIVSNHDAMIGWYLIIFKGNFKKTPPDLGDGRSPIEQGKELRRDWIAEGNKYHQAYERMHRRDKTRRQVEIIAIVLVAALCAGWAWACYMLYIHH
jgi:hypothetical protein